MGDKSRNHFKKRPNKDGTTGRKWLAAPATLLAGTVGFAPQALGADQRPDVCSTSFDPYKASEATRDACGIKSFPLRDRITHADGSIEYTYTVQGNPVEIVLPPTDFDATKASPPELTRYGIPPQPPASDLAGRADWEHAIRNLHPIQPPNELLQLPVQADWANTDIWSGFLVHGSFVTAEGSYTEPTDLGTGCPGNAAVFWSGIGGRNSDDLAQNGSAINTPGLGQHQAWWEVLPPPPGYGEGIIAYPYSATANQRFKAGTNRVGDHYSFYWYNYASGQAAQMNVTTPTYDDTTAEFIAERPSTIQPDGTTVPLPLTNFGNFHQVSAKANGNPIQSYPTTTINMRNDADTHYLALTYNALTSDGGFDVRWKNCS